MTTTFTQFGLASAFLSGLYDDEFTLNDIAQQGDFGHGTFNAVDGEMIALDGKFYRADRDGKISVVNPCQQAPIATVTHFKSDRAFELNDVRNLSDFQDKIIPYFHKKNTIHAIRVDAVFESLHARSESAQGKPYQPLDISMPTLQHTFSLEQVRATLVGYFVPEIYKSIVLSGFHFHFVDNTRTKGGHVFDFKFDSGTVNLQYCTELCVRLPLTQQFDQMDLTQDTQKAFQIAEHGR